MNMLYLWEGQKQDNRRENMHTLIFTLPPVSKENNFNAENITFIG